jgi:NAD dependent epimerase/dehydratase family enzyme
VAAIQHLLDTQAAGIFNTTTPNPVRNHELANAAGQALRRPTVFPVPRLVLKMLLGEQATLVCDGQRALPRAPEAHGFYFAYPTISAAIENLTRT